MKKIVSWLLVVCTVPWLAGCAGLPDSTLTGKLWDRNPGPFDHVPALPPNAAFYQTADAKDTLVLYDEARGSGGRTSRRAYLLSANQHRIATGKQPHFVDPHLADNLPRILLETNAIGPSPNAYISPRVVILTSDGRAFSLFANGQEFGPYHLPIYKKAGSDVERAALTPVAVAGDVIFVATVAAAVAGLVSLVGYSETHSD